MRCIGNFVFKSLEKRSGGEFTNDKGQAIKYDEAYVLKVDEETDKGIMERKFKFPTTNTMFFDSLKGLQPYTRVCIQFDISFYGNQVKALPLCLVGEE